LPHAGAEERHGVPRGRRPLRHAGDGVGGRTAALVPARVLVRPRSVAAGPVILNLRYHVVSLVAVFLALGIGVIMGATVIDRVTVDQLRNRLDSVEKSVSQTRKDN